MAFAKKIMEFPSNLGSFSIFDQTAVKRTWENPCHIIYRVFKFNTVESIVITVNQGKLYLIFCQYFCVILDERENLSLESGDGQEKTVIEFGLLALPCLVYNLLVCWCGYYVLDPNLPFLISSSIPPPFQNFITISICLVTENILVAVYLSWLIYGVFIFISFILVFIQATELQTKDITEG